MKYELVIFDMDGTILNTLEDLADSLNAALRRSGFPERSLAEVRGFVGNGIRKLVERGLPKAVKSTTIETVYADFTSEYKLHCADKTKAYGGVTACLTALRQKGIRTAVVSNKADFAVQALCAQYFDGLFDAAIGEKSDVRKKPYPDSVNAVLQTLRITRERAVYIGDSEVDIQTAANAGMDCISVDWGFRDHSALEQAGAQRIVSDAETLTDYLLGA